MVTTECKSSSLQSTDLLVRALLKNKTGIKGLMTEIPSLQCPGVSFMDGRMV